MIIVGIDFGDARTGIAVCDKYEMMASEAGCIAADSYKKAIELVGERVKELKAELIVVGNPVNMDGSSGWRSDKCKAFARELSEATGIPAEMYDERLTTAAATRVLLEADVSRKKRKKVVDKMAAVLILQGYLDYTANQAARRQNDE